MRVVRAQRLLVNNQRALEQPLGLSVVALCSQTGKKRWIVALAGETPLVHATPNIPHHELWNVRFFSGIDSHLTLPQSRQVVKADSDVRMVRA